MSDRLNERFNKSWGRTTCKSTDVPGLSKSAIPILAKAGKRAIHLGYNSACRVPNIPMAFLWTHEETATQLLTFVNNNYGDLSTSFRQNPAHRLTTRKFTLVPHPASNAGRPHTLTLTPHSPRARQHARARLPLQPRQLRPALQRGGGDVMVGVDAGALSECAGAAVLARRLRRGRPAHRRDTAAGYWRNRAVMVLRRQVHPFHRGPRSQAP